jgi:hypothetical protein
MVAKLSPSKAARVAHAMLKKLNDKKPLPSKSATKQNGVEIENAP